MKEVGAAKHRELFNFMREANIGVQVHYIPVHLHPFYTQLGFRKGDFQEAEEYARSSFSIPLYPGLTPTEQDYVVEVLAKGLETL